MVHNIQEIIDQVYLVLSKNNPNNFNELGLDEQANSCIRIARCILLLKEEKNGINNYKADNR